MGVIGKQPKVYRLRINGKLIGDGTIDIIAKKMNIKRSALETRLSRYRKNVEQGIKSKVIYELSILEDSVHQYAMFIDGEYVSHGTIRKLSEETLYSYEYLQQIANGTYGKRNKKMRRKIELYKKC